MRGSFRKTINVYVRAMTLRSKIHFTLHPCVISISVTAPKNFHHRHEKNRLRIKMVEGGEQKYSFLSLFFKNIFIHTHTKTTRYDCSVWIDFLNLFVCFAIVYRKVIYRVYGFKVKYILKGFCVMLEMEFPDLTVSENYN